MVGFDRSADECLGNRGFHQNLTLGSQELRLAVSYFSREFVSGKLVVLFKWTALRWVEATRAPNRSKYLKVLD